MIRLWFCFLMLSSSIAHSAILGELASQVSDRTCELENCWKNAFPKIAPVIEDGVNALNIYAQNIRVKLAAVQKLQSPTDKEEIANLSYRLKLLDGYLSECEDLKLGPYFPRHLIVVGKSFEGDSENFTIILDTALRDLRKELCGPEVDSDSYRLCVSQIVIKRETNKDDLAAYLQFLGKNSALSFTYIGHGIKDGLILGEKDLLLPADHSSSLNISKEEWVKLNKGVFPMTDVVAGLGKRLDEVVPVDAPTRYYACNVGKEFAPAFKSLNPERSVEAATGPMYLRYWDPQKEEWVYNWDGEPLPKFVKKKNSNEIEPTRAEMVMDPRIVHPLWRSKGKGEKFSQVAAKSPSTEKTDSTGITTRLYYDQAARDIVFRLARNSANRATLSDGTQIVFTPDEQQLLNSIFKLHHEKMDTHSWTANVSYLSIQEKIEASARFEKEDYVSRQQKLMVERLLKKLDRCIKESTLKYYK